MYLGWFISLIRKTKKKKLAHEKIQWQLIVSKIHLYYWITIMSKTNFHYKQCYMSLVKDNMKKMSKNGKWCNLLFNFKVCSNHGSTQRSEVLMNPADPSTMKFFSWTIRKLKNAHNGSVPCRHSAYNLY